MVISLVERVRRIYPDFGISVQLREGLGGYARYAIPYTIPSTPQKGEE
jgi:hypothetical protein